MAFYHSKTTRISLRVALCLLLFTLALLCPDPGFAWAMGKTVALPSFDEFSRLVQNGQRDVLRGVYVDSVLALPVVQQPAGETTYVSDHEGEATQFGTASQYGTVGLLAHNHMAGSAFSQLSIDQEVHLIYGDGFVETFVVKAVLKFQALQPDNPYSSFRNLNRDETLSATQLFNRVYSGYYHLTFQTCIAANGKSSWGRLFIIAIPKQNSRSHE